MTSDRIEKSVVLRAPRARVWRAISDSQEFGAWFGVKFDAPFAPGATMHGKVVPTTVHPAQGCAQKPYENLPFQITIDEIVPESRFSFRWHPYDIDPEADLSGEPTTLIVFELEEASGGILLKITESGFDRIPLERRAKAFPANARGWEMQIHAIELYLGNAG